MVHNQEYIDRCEIWITVDRFLRRVKNVLEKDRQWPAFFLFLAVFIIEESM